MLGALIAAWVATKEAERKSLDQDLVWDMLPWLLVAGILGARIWHILTPPASMVALGFDTHYYLTHPLAALAIWNGGLGIPGAVMAGAFAIYVYGRRHKIQFGVLVDIIAPGLALAQAIGRWGNFINQELYGAPTDLPWAIFIDPAHRLVGYSDIAYYHPLFLYESLWNLLNAAFLLWLAHKFVGRLKAGDIFLVYLITYPFARFWLEYLRLDPSPVGTVNANQTLMAVVAVSAALGLFLRHRLGSSKSSPVEAEASQSVESPGEETHEDSAESAQNLDS